MKEQKPNYVDGIVCQMLSEIESLNCRLTSYDKERRLYGKHLMDENAKIILTDDLRYFLHHIYKRNTLIKAVCLLVDGDW